VPTAEMTFGLLLATLLVGLAGYFAWKQVQALRNLRGSQEPREDRYYFRNQALRRLFGCVLMVALAGMLAGWFVFGLDEVTTQLVQEGEAAAAREDRPAKTPEKERAVAAASLYMVLTLVVLLGLLFTAAVDALAIRRYSRRHFQKINDDRRAMIARQAARVRSERNGHR
jgi:hypothetical protein